MRYSKLIIDLRGSQFKVHIRNLCKRDKSFLDRIGNIIVTSNKSSDDQRRSAENYLHHALKHLSHNIEDIAFNRKSKSVTIELDHTPVFFHYILDYYVSGHLHLPSSFCSRLLREELEFWSLSEDVLGTCCWGKYKEDQEKHKTLQRVQKEWGIDDCVGLQGSNSTIKDDEQTIRTRVADFINEPQSSRAAKAYSWLMVLVVILSVTGVTLETLPNLRVSIFEGSQNITEMKLEQYFRYTRPVVWLRVLDGFVIIAIFIDFLLRFYSTPYITKFLVNLFNIIDIVVILPSIVVFACNMLYNSTGYSEYLLEAIYVLNIVRVFRVLRIFRVMTHYKSLKIIFWAWKTSYQELVLLLVILFLFCAIYGSLVFYVEIVHDNFMNIPEGLWWAVVTMTTVGYGDMHPVSMGGYAVGTVCAITGLVVVAMPVPIIVQNFGRFYYAVQTCERLKQKQAHDKDMSRTVEGYDSNKPQVPDPPIKVEREGNGYVRSLSR